MRLSFSTEALADASARHPWRVIGLWLALLLGSAVVIWTLLSSSRTTETHVTNNPESEQADSLLNGWLGPDHDI